MIYMIMYTMYIYTFMILYIYILYWNCNRKLGPSQTGRRQSLPGPKLKYFFVTSLGYIHTMLQFQSLYGELSAYCYYDIRYIMIFNTTPHILCTLNIFTCSPYRHLKDEKAHNRSYYKHTSIPAGNLDLLVKLCLKVSAFLQGEHHLPTSMCFIGG